MMAGEQKVRVVRCPRCDNYLPEPSGTSVYQCGGCGAVLRAKGKVPLNEKKDSGSCEKLEYLSEQGGSSLAGASASEWGSPSMEPSPSRIERDYRSRRTAFSNSPIRTNDKEDLDNYEKKSEKGTKGVWPMQRLGDKEVGLVEDTHGRFSEQRIENWVRRYNLEKDMNIYDSDSSSTAATHSNPIGTARTRANFEHQRVERDASRVYLGNSMAVADRKGIPNFRHPSDRPSSSNLDMFYAHHEPVRTYENPVEGLDPNRAELLRRLDELKDQILKSCDLGDKPRVVTDRAPVDSYYGRPTYNVPMQSSTQSPPHIHGPHYSDLESGTFTATGHHHRNGDDFLHPPRHVVKDIPLYEDRFQQQMIRKANYPPTRQYPPRLPREHYPESFVDFEQDLHPPHAQDAFFHHPTCSCSQCSKRNMQGPPQAPNSPISNLRNPKEPIKSSMYHNEDPVPVGLRASNSQRVNRFPSQDIHPHSRQPSELESDIDGFRLGQPSTSVLQRNGKIRDAIAGGAPFIVCISCLELLKLPRKLYKLEMNWQKLQCGACSVVITVKVENRRLVVSIPAENKAKEVPPDDGSPKRVVNATNSCLESSDNSSNKLIDTSHDKPSNDRDLNIGESKKQEVKSSPLISSKEEETPASNCDLKDLSNSAELPTKNTPSLANSNENSDKSSYNEHEPSTYREGSENEQNIVIHNVSGASELDVSFEDYSNTHVSQDSVEISKEEEEEEDQNKTSKESETFFVGLSRNNLRDFSRSSEIVDNGRPNVSVNGQPLPPHVVKKAEKLAGPILPGDYWYDYQAGFWGVMGHPCLGIIPPFIDEFTYPMPRNCASGNTGIYINGRELNQKDLELLSSRGLPTTTNKFYRIDISGRVVNENSGKELYFLGKLAPTIEKVKHGFGMKVPRTLK